MEILRCEGVEKVFGKGENQVIALSGVNLSVEKGEFVAIVGASGSGKSTLLHILGSVDRPTRGTVTVDGVAIGELSAAQAAIFRRRKVGLIYQFYNLIPTLTVEKNILMPMLLDKRKPEPDYLETLVRTLGIADKMESMPSQLSGGQQQKNAKEIIDLLKLSNRNWKQTILLITHDESVALEADRIVTLADGQIVSDQKRG